MGKRCNNFMMSCGIIRGFRAKGTSDFEILGEQEMQMKSV